MRPSHKQIVDEIELRLMRLVSGEFQTISQKLDKIMADQADLQTHLDALKASVDALPDRIGAPVDLQPQVDEVDALKAAVDAINPAP